SPSNSFSVFSPFSALSAGSCPLALSGSGKPLTQGSPLNPSHLRWGCCMHYCGAPDAGGSRLDALVRCGFWKIQHLLWTPQRGRGGLIPAIPHVLIKHPGVSPVLQATPLSRATGHRPPPTAPVPRLGIARFLPGSGPHASARSSLCR